MPAPGPRRGGGSFVVFARKQALSEAGQGDGGA